MEIAITLSQTNTVDSEGKYAVASEILASTGIPLALFVYSRSTSMFDRIASVRDVETYPETLETAVTEDSDYYRMPQATCVFTRVVDAEAFASVVRSSLSYLTADYRRYKESFVGITEYTYRSEG
jgi:hypothetical protein